MFLWRWIISSRLHQFVRNHPKSAGVVAAVVTPLIVLTALLGGFNTSTEVGPAETKVGAKVELGPLDVTVHSANYTNKSPAISYKGHPYYLMVRATVVVKNDEPMDASELKNAITVPALKASEESENTDAGELLVDMVENDVIPVLTDDRANNMYVGTDLEYLSDLNPGVPAEVTFAWDIDRKIEPMKNVKIEINDYEFAPLTTLKRENKWLRGSGVAAMELPVTLKMEPEDDTL
ncbi:hypothetical protein [Tenggerimyces flavus]|uniref:DUF4352 domain-containing protein n=1 Tax=Tenggerimyces flavus TaxID=1708749 RepID=A0ABV7YGU3_9ACTN|nr:hypothetical protein [Tenggerimyces flavus]MBM7784571.1 hypothetical protein [Tenggerimyces flavus]